MKCLQRSNEACNFKVHYRFQLLLFVSATFSPTFTVTVPIKQKFVVTGNTERKPRAIHTAKIAPFP
jgi:hypothetical protein